MDLGANSHQTVPPGISRSRDAAYNLLFESRWQLTPTKCVCIYILLHYGRGSVGYWLAHYSVGSTDHRIYYTTEKPPLSKKQLLVRFGLAPSTEASTVQSLIIGSNMEREREQRESYEKDRGKGDMSSLNTM